MTTVAWDGRYLAADSGSNLGDVRVAHDKIVPIIIRRVPPGATFASGPAFISGAGDAGSIRAFARWLESEGDDGQPIGDYHAIVVTRRGAWSTDSAGCWDYHGKKPMAVGSGGGMALVALVLGASAKAACEIVLKYGAPGYCVTPIRVRDAHEL